mgnify:CR=1 FL=1
MVIWVASLGLALAFAGLPLQAFAAGRPGGLLSVNATGTPSADDPGIEHTPQPPAPPLPNAYAILLIAAADQNLAPTHLLDLSL